MPASEILYTVSPSNDSAVSIEVIKTGLLSRRKHLFCFESFEGQLYYLPDRREPSRISLCLHTGSLICRDRSLRPKKQEAVGRYAREKLLAASHYPEIRFSSRDISAKPLRGFAVEGALDVCDVTRSAKVNLVFNATRSDRLQIDGDAILRFSDFGRKAPSALLGLIGTKDEVLVRLLLWATPAR